MVKLYHYTSTGGKNGIEGSKVISMSTDTVIDAVYGKGVYLTSLGPTSSTAAILGNNYDGMIIAQHLKDKTEWYFEFDSDDDVLKGIESVGKAQGRDVWLLRDKDLVCTIKAVQRKV